MGLGAGLDIEEKEKSPVPSRNQKVNPQVSTLQPSHNTHYSIAAQYILKNTVF
jgi:hypothetical protein